MSRPLCFVGALLAAAYVACTAAVVARSGSHLVLELVLVQYVFLLPALICYLRGSRESQVTSSPRAGWPVAIFCMLYAVVVASVALGVLHKSKGLQFGDELAYRFQSRVFMERHIAAEAPPKMMPDRNDFYFDHFLIHQNKWTGQYPPGWPAVLAVGTLLNQGWLLNPLLGLCILWITYYLGILVFDEEVARLAVFFMVLSPSFLLNSCGFMSHPLDGVLLAAAALLFFRGLRSQQLNNFVIMVVLVAFAAFVRPWTAFCIGTVLAVAALWSLRHERRRLLGLTMVAVLIGASASALLLTYNHALTGSYSRSTYAIAKVQNVSELVSFDPMSMEKTAASVTRQSLVQTDFYAIPFLLLLGVLCLFAEKERRGDVLILGALFAILVIGYTIVPLWSASTVGERYYYESFFALAILGARGWSLLRARWALGGARVVTLVVIVVCAFHYVLAIQAVRLRVAPHVHIMNAIEHLRLRDAVVYVKGDSASHFNENAADWRHAPVFYMMDPGPSRRELLARALDRNEWVVIGYNAKTSSAEVEQFHPNEAGRR
jgi:hypothetical protein